MPSVTGLNPIGKRPAFCSCIMPLPPSAIGPRNSPAKVQPVNSATRRWPLHITTSDFHGCDPQFLCYQLSQLGIMKIEKGLIRLTKKPNILLTNLGDNFDRGPLNQARADWTIFQELQRQAKAQGDNGVVRLIGNHEASYLQDVFLNHCEENATIRREIKQLIREDILKGLVLAAFADDNLLFTHAGVDLGFLSQFSGKPAAQVALEINEIFLSAVQNENYEHPIFDFTGGIFWTRNFPGLKNPYFRQRIGHTPQVTNGLEPGTLIFGGPKVSSADKSLVIVDTGRIFGEQDRALQAFKSQILSLQQHANAFVIYQSQVEPLQ